MDDNFEKIYLMLFRYKKLIVLLFAYLFSFTQLLNADSSSCCLHLSLFCLHKKIMLTYRENLSYKQSLSI